VRKQTKTAVSYMLNHELAYT